MVISMNQRRRPLERTRKYDIWAEHRSSAVGPYQLVLQVVDELSGDGTMLIRASYRRDETMRPSQPMFESGCWVEVLSAAIRDPAFFSDDEVEALRQACDARGAS